MNAFLTITDHEVSELADQSDRPFWDRDWIAPELRELLFDQPADDAPLRTYFLVDASMRTELIGGFDLDTVDVPAVCLFQGATAEDLEEAAPYLLDLTLPNGAQTSWDNVPAFHKEFFPSHWDQNTGFFIRTTAPISQVRAHMRKFTRVQIEEDRRWIYFRFWDPRIAPSYFDSIRGEQAKVAQWMQMRDAHRISAIIGNHVDSRNAWQLKADFSLLAGAKITPNPLLSNEEIKGLERYRLYRYERRALAFISQSYPKVAKTLTEDQMIVFIQSAYAKAKARGILSEREQFKYLTSSILLGSSFETDPQFAPMINETRFGDHRYADFGILFAAIDHAKAAIWEDLTLPKRVLLGFERLYSSPPKDVNYDMAEEKIRQIWPKYAARISSTDWHQFIGHAGGVGHGLGLSGPDLIMYICLAVFFGAEFANDPLYPWAKEALEIQDDDKRRHALGTAGLTHFQIMLEKSIE